MVHVSWQITLVSELAFLKTVKEIEKHCWLCWEGQQPHKSPSTFKSKSPHVFCWKASFPVGDLLFGLVCELLLILRNPAHLSPVWWRRKGERSCGALMEHLLFSRHCVGHLCSFILFSQQHRKAGISPILQKRKVGLNKNLANMWWNQDLNPSLALYIILYIISFEFTCPYSGL